MNGWISVGHRRPVLGQIVILYANGVVQQNTYMYDMSGKEEFWSQVSDDIAEGYPVNFSDFWMPIPKGPYDRA